MISARLVLMLNPTVHVAQHCTTIFTVWSPNADLLMDVIFWTLFYHKNHICVSSSGLIKRSTDTPQIPSWCPVHMCVNVACSCYSVHHGCHLGLFYVMPCGGLFQIFGVFRFPRINMIVSCKPGFQTLEGQPSATQVKSKGSISAAA